MTDEEKKRIVRDQLHAFNRHNEDAFVEVTATNCRTINIPSGETLTGTEGSRQFFRRWHNAFPDGKTTIEAELVSGDTVTVLFRGEGTQSGPLGPFPPRNKQAVLQFASVNRLDAQGKIAETATYYDQLSLLAQLGADIPALVRESLKLLETAS